MTILGGYYRQYLVHQGLLTGIDAVDVNSEYSYADNAERTYATGQALAAGLLPSVPSTVNELANGASDPLFYPVKLWCGKGRVRGSVLVPYLLGRSRSIELWRVGFQGVVKSR